MGEEETRGILEGRRKVVASRGSGMTAGVLWLGLILLGVKGVALYNGVRSFVIMSAIGGLIGSPLGLDQVRDETAEQNRKRGVTCLVPICPYVRRTSYVSCSGPSYLYASGVTLIPSPLLFAPQPLVGFEAHRVGFLSYH